MNLGNSQIRDRLRKRRCFADKELDNIPPISITVNNILSTSAFRTTTVHSTNHSSLEENPPKEKKAHRKKCTDFSVAAIIGQ